MTCFLNFQPIIYLHLLLSLRVACGHRYTLHRTRVSYTELETNAIPGMKKDDVDFAENLTLPNARSIQSEYWSLIQTTLFICISKMLLLSAWVRTTGALKVGAEVTVEQAECMPF